ncbi:MAG: T9SS C-terminal target domain-containing protein [Calditrichaeota bacterium]|nr:MAG: T9SS C-terminal target domain-containing protein [Calditrichota bacterium]
MKKLSVLILLIIIIPVVSHAVIDYPDQTLLSTSVGVIELSSGYMVSASIGGISVYEFDEMITKFKFVNRFYFDIDPVSMKISDTLLIVHDFDNSLYYYSINNLPEISYLGNIDLNKTFADFEIVDNSLYISRYFEGVEQYDISDITNPQFADSSMKGILVTQLEHDNDYLYVMDEYNGLLRYSFEDNSFGTFLDYLFVPFRAFGFEPVDSLFYLKLSGGGVMVGDFNQPHTAQIIDSIPYLPEISDIYSTDSMLYFMTQRESFLIQKNNLNEATSFDISLSSPIGTVFKYQTDEYLLLPNLNGGLALYDLSTAFDANEGLSYNGKINDMYIYNSSLFVSNSEEPIQNYNISENGEITYNYTIYPQVYPVSYLQNNGDTLFGVLPDIDKVALMINSTMPESVFIENTITYTASSITDFHYSGTQIYDYSLLFLEQTSAINLILISDSGYFETGPQWNAAAPFTSFVFKDSIGYMTDTKRECSIVRVNSDFSRTLINSFSLSDKAEASIIKGDTLYLFSEDKMFVIDITDPYTASIDTSISTPLPVTDALVVGDFIYTVGYEGLSVFDISTGSPEIYEYGGLPGTTIEADSNLIAVIDENNLMIYNYALPFTNNPGDDKTQADNQNLLTQNYPNPFNLETTISFRLPQAGKVSVSVFNILGQEVRNLVSEYKEAGVHTISWDGKNKSGSDVASGMYLYKLKTDDYLETKKMLLIK